MVPSLFLTNWTTADTNANTNTKSNTNTKKTKNNCLVAGSWCQMIPVQYLPLYLKLFWRKKDAKNTQALRSMLATFQHMFGNEFWRNAILEVCWYEIPEIKYEEIKVTFAKDFVSFMWGVRRPKMQSISLTPLLTGDAMESWPWVQRDTHPSQWKEV